MAKSRYKQGKQICSMADFEKSECLYFRIRFGNGFQTKHRSFLISWQYRTLLNFIQSGRVFEAIQVPMAIEIVVCCGEFTQAVLVASKLDADGWTVEGEESISKWLIKTFSKTQFGINFILHGDKTVTWCGNVYLIGVKGTYYEIPAKTFLGW